MEMLVRVAIVEDDADLREWLNDAVTGAAGMQVSGVYGSAELFLEGAGAQNCDVVLMDIHLPGASGIACMRTIKKVLPAVQFIMCTVFEDADSIFDALRSGATGYILKNTSSDRIVEGIREVMAGGSPMSPQVARKVIASFSSPGAVGPDQAMHRLSAREKEIVELLAQGFRYKEIADRLFISTETVRTHIRNIYEKLQVQSRTEALNKLYPRF